MLMIFIISGTQQISSKTKQHNRLDTIISKEVDKYVTDELEKVSFPGLALAIIKEGEPIYIKTYGFADIENRKEVRESTLFEIGSNSKAFTALGILLLQENGLLKLNDPVTKYIPWFKPKYGNLVPEIQLKHLLYHTSGLSHLTISSITPDESDNALEKAVKSIAEEPLLYKPDSLFYYVTANYDVLGYVIEKVSGLSFEDYMSKEILMPLGLLNTHLNREECLKSPDMAKGYKSDIQGNEYYRAPTYRGNLPAGYFISNINDMAKWVSINMQDSLPTPELTNAIRKSHIPNTSVDGELISPYTEPIRYGGGWLVFDNQGLFIGHGGSNPNFSSYMLINFTEKLGIVILGNRNSGYPYQIAQNILFKLTRKGNSIDTSDMPYTANKIFTICFFILILAILLMIINIAFISRKISQKRRYYNARKLPKTIFISITILIITAVLIYSLPIIIFYGFPWKEILVWAPDSFISFIISLYTFIGMLTVAIGLKKIYPLTTKKQSNDRQN